ncbi:MAG TPA: hypothetical protein VN764_13290 [Polyangiaceae bacterium]|nr:hypothetical protein [Polyangiaceae bacterium]
MSQCLEIADYSASHFAHTLHTVGSFAWWYADLTDSEGNGLVLVWAYGLPFLPGSRLPEPARARPSLHLAKYTRGRPTFYLLQRYLPQEASLGHDGQGTLGACYFSVSESGHHIQLTSQLNLEIPGSQHRLTGELTLEGRKAALPTADGSPAHVWAPRCVAARGQAILAYDGEVHRLEGAAYFDSNLSRLPLQEQGISSWRWGRVSFDDETVVYYDISGRGGDKTTLVCSQGRNTKLHFIDAAPMFCRERRGNFGLSGPRQVDIETSHAHYRFSLEQLVDDGPFYQRYLVTGKRTSLGPHGGGSATGHGIAELVHPSKVDVPWQRPFVAMKTHHIGARNSLLLPFFSGFRRDRAKRTVAAWTQSMRSS